MSMPPEQPTEPDRRSESSENQGPLLPPSADHVTVGDIRDTLRRGGASWQVSEHLRDDQLVPRYPLGGNRERVEPASDERRIDFAAELGDLPANPALLRRRMELSLVAPEQLEFARSLLEQDKPGQDEVDTAAETPPDSDRRTTE